MRLTRTWSNINVRYCSPTASLLAVRVERLVRPACFVLTPQPILQLLRGSIAQALGGKHLDVGYPGQHSTDEFLPPGCLQPHLNPAIGPVLELLDSIEPRRGGQIA